MKDQEQDQLLQKCLAGKPSAQRRFYERYAPRLFGICLRYARTEAEAQDWLQEAFIRIFRDLKQHRGVHRRNSRQLPAVADSLPPRERVQGRPVYEHRFEYDFQLEMIYDYLEWVGE